MEIKNTLPKQSAQTLLIQIAQNIFCNTGFSTFVFFNSCLTISKSSTHFNSSIASHSVWDVRICSTSPQYRYAPSDTGTSIDCFADKYCHHELAWRISLYLSVCHSYYAIIHHQHCQFPAEWVLIQHIIMHCHWERWPQDSPDCFILQWFSDFLP